MHRNPRRLVDDEDQTVAIKDAIGEPQPLHPVIASLAPLPRLRGEREGPARRRGRVRWAAASAPASPHPDPCAKGEGGAPADCRATGAKGNLELHRSIIPPPRAPQGRSGSASRSASHSSAPKRRNISGTVISFIGVGWRWVVFNSASIRSQMPTTLLIKQPRHDRELVAHRFGLPQIEIGRLAAPYDIEEAGPVDQARHRGDLVLRLRRLDKRHVGPGRQRRIGAGNGLVQAGDGARVGAGDDQEVLVAAGGGRGADLGDVVLARDDLLAFEMAAFLREFLILDVNPGNAAALEFANRAKDIELVAVAGIGIGDDGQLDGGGDPPGIGHHLGHRDEAKIGVSQCRRGAGPGHVDRGESRLFDELGGDAIIGPGRHHHPLPLQQIPKAARLGHRLLP